MIRAPLNNLTVFHRDPALDNHSAHIISVHTRCTPIPFPLPMGRMLQKRKFLTNFSLIRCLTFKRYFRIVRNPVQKLEMKSQFTRTTLIYIWKGKENSIYICTHLSTLICKNLMENQMFYKIR